jgi:hypothetical protein
VRETEHFINEDYGWACKRCLESRGATQDASAANSPPAATRRPSVADSPTGATSNADSSSSANSDADSSTRAPALARFFREGEAEERETRLSADALARWKDDSRRALVCPRCGVEETIKG